MFVQYVDVIIVQPMLAEQQIVLVSCCVFALFIDIVRQKWCRGSSSEVHGMVLGLVAQLQVGYLPHYECVCC